MYSLQELTDISVRAAYGGDLQSMRVCLNEIYSGSGSSSSFRGMDERGGNGYVTPGDPSSLEPLIQTLEASLRGGNQEIARENMIAVFGMCDTFRGDLDSILERTGGEEYRGWLEELVEGVSQGVQTCAGAICKKIPEKHPENNIKHILEFYKKFESEFDLQRADEDLKENYLWKNIMDYSDEHKNNFNFDNIALISQSLYNDGLEKSCISFSDAFDPREWTYVIEHNEMILFAVVYQVEYYKLDNPLVYQFIHKKSEGVYYDPKIYYNKIIEKCKIREMKKNFKPALMAKWLVPEQATSESSNTSDTQPGLSLKAREVFGAAAADAAGKS